MTRTIVLVGEDVGQANLGRMQEAFPGVEFRLCRTADELIRQAGDAEIIFSKRFPPQVLEREGRLRWIGAACLTGVCLKSMAEIVIGEVVFAWLHFKLCGTPIAVCHAGGVVGGVIAFFVLGNSMDDNRLTRNYSG